ncbi:MAG TPA: hypothetical protein VGK88_11130 [bacterium]
MTGSSLTIALRLREIAHLFKPSAATPLSDQYYPFGSKPGIEQALAEIYAHPRAREVTLVITLPLDHLTPGLDGTVQDAVRRYADARILEARYQSIKTRDQATRALPLAVLGLILIAGSVPLMDPSLSYLVQLAGNGLSVAGWVAVWYPLDSLIFQVWLQRQDGRAYLILRDTHVSVRAET